MRYKLSKLGAKERHTFVGEFVRYGYKNAFRSFPLKTVLLKNIHLIDSDETLTDHLWFNFTKEFESQNFQEGDLMQFDARVSFYLKGYMGYKEDVNCSPISKDCKLSYPTRIKNLSHPAVKIQEVKNQTKKYANQKEETIITKSENIPIERRKATDRQIEYINGMCAFGGYTFDGEITFLEASYLIDLLQTPYILLKRRKQSIDTFYKVQKAIDEGLTQKEAIKKLSISITTYSKYKNKNWIKSLEPIDLESYFEIFKNKYPETKIIFLKYS